MVKRQNKVNTWAEYIILETAKPLAWYDHKFFQKYPAITINNYGKGTMLYEGSMVSDAIQNEIIKQAIVRAGLKTSDQDIHWPLITKSGTNDEGKTIHYYYNYSSEPVKFVYPYNEGKELTSDRKVVKKETSDNCTLGFADC